jgi:hypothetical protein
MIHLVMNHSRQMWRVILVDGSLTIERALPSRLCHEDDLVLVSRSGVHGMISRGSWSVPILGTLRVFLEGGCWIFRLPGYHPPSYYPSISAWLATADNLPFCAQTGDSGRCRYPSLIAFFQLDARVESLLFLKAFP